MCRAESAQTPVASAGEAHFRGSAAVPLPWTCSPPVSAPSLSDLPSTRSCPRQPQTLVGCYTHQCLC